MNSRNPNMSIHYYLISFQKDTNLTNLRNINGVNNISVKWEKYSRKIRITQCPRWQQFGHGQHFCNLDDRCVEYAGQHSTANCNMIKTNTLNRNAVPAGGIHIHIKTFRCERESAPREYFVQNRNREWRGETVSQKKTQFRNAGSQSEHLRVCFKYTVVLYCLY